MNFMRRNSQGGITQVLKATSAKMASGEEIKFNL